MFKMNYKSRGFSQNTASLFNRSAFKGEHISLHRDGSIQQLSLQLTMQEICMY